MSIPSIRDCIALTCCMALSTTRVVVVAHTASLIGDDALLRVGISGDMHSRLFAICDWREGF